MNADAKGTSEALAMAWMIARAVGVYAAGLLLVRLGKSRLLSRTTAFDVVLGVMLGSMLSRAINGTAAVAPTLAAVAALVAVHRALAWLTIHVPGLGPLLNGRARVLVEDGRVDWEGVRREELTRDDLLEGLRLSGGVEDPATVRRARLERNGQVSVVGHGS